MSVRSRLLWRKESRGITLPKGFLVSSLASGIKRKGGKDLALLYSSVPAQAACLFTTNRIKAAPVRFSLNQLRHRRDFQAILVNSGNANCGTGRAGLCRLKGCIGKLALRLKLPPAMILAASTGIIGRPLPFERIEDKLDILIQGLARGRSADTGAAQAIMTTDTRMKQAGMSASMGGHIVSIGGMAKGSGMISPGLATMLVFITTDAVIQGKWLGAALKEAVEGSFDCIDVDAEMSTNDSVFFLANGKADNPPLRQGTREAEFFKEGLKHVAKVLAQMIIQDAEGATKMIEITIKGARSFQEARYLAKRLSRSFLFKTAMFGNLPNWGRVLSAMGDAGVDVEEKSLDITLAKQRVFRRGEPVRFDEDKLKQQLKKRNIKVEIDIHRGGDSCTVLTSDLSVEYVRINAGYS